jgi:hypothetical protein
MAEDPYSVLGLPAHASRSEVRHAFLRLAKRYHPDLNAGDKFAEARFKEVAAAHDQIEKFSTLPWGQVPPRPGGPAEPPARHYHAAARAQWEYRPAFRRRTPVRDWLAELGLDLLEIVVWFFKAVDDLLNESWALIKILLALR